MGPRSPLVAFGLIFFAVFGAVAHQQREFRADVKLVGLDVSVTDSHGRFVPSLQASDFTVLEDGAPQQITLFQAGEVPLAVALLLDISPSMIPSRELVHEGAIGLVHSLGSRDVAAVLDFDTGVRLRQPFTRD